MTRTKQFVAALCLALGLMGAIATPAMADKQRPAPGTAVAASAATDIGITDASDCVLYLADMGYTVGPVARSACQTGSSGTLPGRTYCVVNLVSIGVADGHAGEACRWAAR